MESVCSDHPAFIHFKLFFMQTEKDEKSSGLQDALRCEDLITELLNTDSAANIRETLYYLFVKSYTSVEIPSAAMRDSIASHHMALDTLLKGIEQLNRREA
jgi:hypothetical protein